MDDPKRVIVSVIFPGDIDRDLVEPEAGRVAGNEGFIHLDPWRIEELRVGVDDKVDRVVARSMGFCADVSEPVMIDWAKVKTSAYLEPDE